jgi:hypothetical protein
MPDAETYRNVSQSFPAVIWSPDAVSLEEATLAAHTITPGKKILHRRFIVPPMQLKVAKGMPKTYQVTRFYHWTRTSRED